MALPLDQLPIGEGVHPDGTPGAEFFVDRRMLDALEEHGPAEKHDDGRFAYECVSHPDAIFEGLKRDNLADAFCYTVRPTHDPQQPDVDTLPRYGLAFLAFVRRGAAAMSCSIGRGERKTATLQATP